MALQLHDQVVTCDRGLECIKRVPIGITELEANVFDESGSLFPECVTCDKGTPADGGVFLALGEDGICHIVKLCTLRFRDPDPKIDIGYKPIEYDKVQATAEAMQRQGGSFVKHLGKALAVADPINTSKIRTAFGEYFEEYWRIAEKNNWYLED